TILKQGELPSRLAAAAFITDTAGDKQTTSTATTLVQLRLGVLIPTLITLTKSPETSLSAAASRALAAISLEPEKTAAALEGVLRNGNVDVDERRAAARALVGLIRGAQDYEKRYTTYTTQTQSKREVLSREPNPVSKILQETDWRKNRLDM